MATKRVFLGWDRPLCETVPDHLLAGAAAGMLDLRDTVVVLPTRQASWRLRAALPLAAHGPGIVLLGPEIVTPPVLLEPPPSAAAATGLQSLLAWSAVLKAVNPGELVAFFGARENRPAGTGWTLQVARRLQDLRRELADGGLSIADVAGRDDIEEAERWRAMADLEGRYIRQLADWRLRDTIDLKLRHVRAGALAPGVRRVVVAAVPDPPRLFMSLLENWAVAGGAAEVLVAAPSKEEGAFDAWGRPLPDAWQARDIPLREGDLWLEATPDDQAARIAGVIAAGTGARPAGDNRRPQLAIGVPDRETVAPLQRELAAVGLPAFDPQNRPLADTALYRLVQALVALRDRPGYAEAAALLRHPDVMATFEDGVGILRMLDAFQAEYLPVTLDDMDVRPSRGAVPPPAEALDRLRGWRARLQDAGLAAGLREVLQQVYAKRMLNPDETRDAAFQQAVGTLDGALREFEQAAAAGQAGADAAEAFMARLRDATIKAERRGESVDLEGWLELAWNPAPLLFVAGMNEGFVPDGHVGDLFLPDTLRRRLGLRDDRLRVARDAYLLTALLAQRAAGGRVVLLVGKTSTAGDPLRPSRLLFRCPDADLVARARALFSDPPFTHAAEAFTVSFALDPARVPAEAVDDRRSRELSPTVFRDYLACPLRFYLRHVLGMGPSDDLAREPDARAFGTLVHDVLIEMGRDRRLWGAQDAEALGRRLEQRLRELARVRYGARPWLGVELAVGSAAQRLHAFARRQTDWHAEGWEIVACEEPRSCTVGGMAVKGRIDRIDRHARTGAVCVLDYKTSEKALQPCEVHLGPARDDEGLAAARVPAATAETTRDKRWVDLQLPLYRELVRAEFGAEVALGYVCLPGALGETQFAVWTPYGDALHASAVACADAVARAISDGVFWPPGRLEAAHADDFEGVLLGEPLKTMRPPAPPWRAAP